MARPMNIKGNNTVEKAPKGTFLKSLSKLLVFCKRYWGWIILSIVFGTVAVVFQIIGPNKIGDIANIIKDTWLTGIDIGSITEIAIFLVCIYVAGAILSYFQQFITATITQKTVKRLRQNISKKINNLPLNYFDTHLHGDILSRVTNDVDTIGESLNQSIGSLISNTILFLGVLVMMFVVDWILALTVIGTTIIGFSFSLIFMTRSQKYFIQNQKNLGDLNAHIEEVYSGHNVVQLFNAQKSKYITSNFY